MVERNDERFYLRATAMAEVPKDGTDDVEFLLRAGEHHALRLLPVLLAALERVVAVTH